MLFNEENYKFMFTALKEAELASDLLVAIVGGIQTNKNITTSYKKYEDTNEDDEAVIDEESWNAANTHFARQSVFVTDEVQVSVFAKKLGDQLGIHTAGPGNLGQHIRIADVAAFNKVGLENRFNDPGLTAGSFGPSYQAVAVQSVGGFFLSFEIEGDAG